MPDEDCSFVSALEVRTDLGPRRRYRLGCSARSARKFRSSAGEQISAFPIGSTLIAMGEQGVASLLRAHRNGLGILLKPVSAVEYRSVPLAEAAE
jgi:hypothetical protein